MPSASRGWSKIWPYWQGAPAPPARQAKLKTNAWVSTT